MGTSSIRLYHRSPAWHDKGSFEVNFPRSAVVVGCARNTAAHLPRVLKNIEALAACFRDVAFIFIENSSNDGTLGVLDRWAQGRSRCWIHELSGLELLIRQRTVRLAACRNLYLHRLRNDPALRGFEVLVIVDLDEVNAQQIMDRRAIEGALDFLFGEPQRGAVFANQPIYRDFWALRHATHFPIDFWESVFDAVTDQGLSDEAAFRQISDRYPLDFISGTAPTPVDSAFGGLGFYKVDHVLRNRHPYCGYKDKYLTKDGKVTFLRMQQCEHVPFHYGMKASGSELFIVPDLINDRSIYGSDPRYFRNLTF